MRGHLRQVRPGVWRLWVDLDTDPVTGDRRRATETLYGTRTEVERQAEVIIGEIAAGRHADPGSITWEGFTADWLGVIGPTVRPTTLDGYGHKTRLVARYIGRRRLGDLTGQVISGMYRRMLDDGLSPRTVAHAHQIVHRVLRDAVRWKLLTANPADAADPPRVERPDIRTWTAEEARRFLVETAEHRLAPLWRTALATGMRRGELLGMRWPALDLEGGLLEVTETRVMVAGKPRSGRPKTTSGRRRIALDGATIDTLRVWKKTQDEHRAFFGDAYQPGDWVWAWEDGKPMSPDWISKQWRATVTTVPRIRFHDLRHTWATLALSVGVPAKVVADRLGHAGIAITLDTYTHHVETPRPRRSHASR